VCELEAYLEQHMCIKHTHICGLRFHVDRMSRNSTAIVLSCWHKRYFLWLVLRSIRFVLRSKICYSGRGDFRPTQTLV